MNMKNGQTYKIKKVKNPCCICGTDTFFWLDNASAYFCLSGNCFTIRHLEGIVYSLRRDVENIKKVFNSWEREE